MGIYFISLYSCFFLLLLSRKCNNYICSKFLAFLFFIIFVAVPGLRVGVGTDYHSYEEWFMNYDTLNSYVNIAFNLLIRFIKLFSNEPQLLFFSSALLIGYFIWSFIKNNSKYTELSIFLFIASYLYFNSFNTIRNWIAISIFLFSLRFIYSQKFKNYFFMIILASMFHISAIIMLPIYFISKIKISHIIFCVIGLTILLYNINTISLVLLPQIPLSQERYMDYVTGRWALDGGGGFAYLTITVLAFVLLLVRRKEYEMISPLYMYHLVFVAICLPLAAFSLINVFYLRMTLYFMPITIVCISNLIATAHKNEKPLIYIFTLFLFTLYLYRSFTINGGEVVPYKFIEIL